MKRITLFLIILILPLTCAQVVNVDILENFDYQIKNLDYDSVVNTIFSANSELYNSGSVGYRVRLRLDILNDSEVIYSGWTSEEFLNPGKSHLFSVQFSF